MLLPICVSAFLFLCLVGVRHKDRRESSETNSTERQWSGPLPCASNKEKEFDPISLEYCGVGVEKLFCCCWGGAVVNVVSISSFLKAFKGTEPLQNVSCSHMVHIVSKFGAAIFAFPILLCFLMESQVVCVLSFATDFQTLL